MGARPFWGPFCGLQVLYFQGHFWCLKPQVRSNNRWISRKIAGPARGAVSIWHSARFISHKPTWEAHADVLFSASINQPQRPNPRFGASEPLRVGDVAWWERKEPWPDLKNVYPRCSMSMSHVVAVLFHTIRLTCCLFNGGSCPADVIVG